MAVVGSDRSSTWTCKLAVMKESKKHHSVSETFPQKIKKRSMLQELNQRSLQAVFSDRLQKLEVLVYQQWARMVHWVEDQLCTMQARHHMSCRIKLTQLQVHKHSSNQQSQYRDGNAQRMVPVVLSSRDQRKTRVKSRLLKPWKIQKLEELLNLKNSSCNHRVQKMSHLKSVVNLKPCS